jgi:hypothetical protein
MAFELVCCKMAVSMKPRIKVRSGGGVQAGFAVMPPSALGFDM